ncbi:MAG: hypothetical protein KIT42_08320 [Rhodocyclaceae bacterium]|nr:hypothetical protein [Rhodocyclaceae bacterium]
MPVWAVAPVSETPELTLCAWQIVETDKQERHFVGYNLNDREGRVSSAITQFDPETLTGVTRSGRIYQLTGKPGIDEDALYVWRRWCSFNGVKSWRYVTNEALAGQ